MSSEPAGISCTAFYDRKVRDEALRQDEERWLIKIGKTRQRTPSDRMKEFTFVADKPHWAVAIWTDEPDQDEQLIIRILTRRGRRHPGNGGKEWFVTNPQELRDIYEKLMAAPDG